MAKRNYLGKTETQTLLYLADKPQQNITRIQEGLGLKNHSAVAKAVRNLSEKGLLTQLGSYKAKGRDIALWGLSRKGIGTALNLGAEFHPVLEKHSKFYDDFKYLSNLEKILCNLIPHWGEEGLSVYKKMVGVITRLDDYGENVQAAAASVILNEWLDKNISHKLKGKIGEEILKHPILKKYVMSNSTFLIRQRSFV